jgi:hypothetical protein
LRLFDKTKIKGSLILKNSKKKTGSFNSQKIQKKNFGTRHSLISDFSEKPKLEFYRKHLINYPILDFGIYLIRPSFARNFEGA